MTRIGVILAGGASRRMGGKDKGVLELGGRRLIDQVAGKLGPQTDHLIIAGPHDFDTGLVATPDREDGPAGPVAGLFAAARWICENEPQAQGFVTAPVDGPFLPDDLYKQLSGDQVCAMAADPSGDHPTFAYWTLKTLIPVLAKIKTGEGAALHGIAKECKAKRIEFPQATLININSPEDLARAEATLG